MTASPGSACCAQGFLWEHEEYFMEMLTYFKVKSRTLIPPSKVRICPRAADVSGGVLLVQ